MKQYLFDHSNGSPTGGLLNYSTNDTGVKMVSLATGTPEAGRKAVVSFGTSGGHIMTISGYNDSVRYDYNGDGKFTNNIDLDSNGVIDVRDWEIGAAITVNTWGSGWGNGGKAFLMYRVLTIAKEAGGGTGKVDQFSAIDYSTGTAVETVCPSANINVANGTTTLKIVKTKETTQVVKLQ